MSQTTCEESLAGAEQFNSYLKILWDELFDANMHFHLTNSLRAARLKYPNEFYHAHYFWGYTIKAHVTTSISALARVYDTR
jgi:hypothetical protein